MVQEGLGFRGLGLGGFGLRGQGFLLWASVPITLRVS